MVARLTFPTGLDEVYRGWTTAGDFMFALHKGSWIPNPVNEVFLADIPGGSELTGIGYARIPVDTPTRTVQLPPSADLPGFIVFDCVDPDFGIISGGEIASWLTLYREITTDADSPIVETYQVNYEATGSSSAIFTVSVNGAIRASTLCPADYS